MKSLGFTPPLSGGGNPGVRKPVRSARFEARSSLPVSAACVVANGARETLSALLSAPVTLRLFEPAIPTPSGWRAILHDARCYRIRGSIADAAIVLRSADAFSLAAALFGESRAPDAGRALSPIECEVLDRMVNAIAANLAAVCGARDGRPERVAEIGGFVTYFELSIEEPVNARLGIALSREPTPETGSRIGIAQLSAVTIAASSSLELGTVAAASVARLEIGALIAIEAASFARGRLTIEGRTLARGACGVRNGRYTLAIDALSDAGYARNHGI